ncbi:MAG TPA: hypothetical protein VNJ09_07235, partial [Chthonomonadales bacterium]|nr:hypothetical protein [Chthonomonadales bacterium]
MRKPFTVNPRRGLIVVLERMEGFLGQTYAYLALDTGATSNITDPGKLASIGQNPSTVPTQVCMTTGSGTAPALRLPIFRRAPMPSHPTAALPARLLPGRLCRLRATLLLTLCILTGCADNPLPPGTVKLVVWGLQYGEESKGLEARVREFERRHPHIKVSILSMGAGQMNPQKLMTAIVGNV